jgi:hypothetical protein
MSPASAAIVDSGGRCLGFLGFFFVGGLIVLVVYLILHDIILSIDNKSKLNVQLESSSFLSLVMGGLGIF